jgi:hypothetical protein
MLFRIAFTLTAVILLAAPVGAQKQKKPELTDFPFWSAPKTPRAHAFVPGLQAALELTPAQIEKILEARATTVDTEEIRALKRKGDPNATADELATAATKRSAATEKLHQEVETILTKDQKALIEKLNDGYAKVVADVGGQFQADFEAAKGNAEETAKLRKDQREAIAEAFNKKLDALLTTEQRAAVKKAAEEEAKRAEANKDKVKPKK